MAQHEHGKMDTEVQEQTFAGFVRAVAYGAGVIILVIVFVGLANG